MKNKTYQTGIGLIEIMIASLVGLFLLGGVIQMFTGSKQTNRMQDSLSRLQENGRFAMDFIARDLRMAGFIGCSRAAQVINTLNTPTGFLYDFANAVQGFESTSASAWTPTIDAAIASPIGGSDIIAIRRADEQSFTVTAHASANADLTLDASATVANLQARGFLLNGANNCALAVVSNCWTAAVFQVSAIAGTTLSHAAVGGCTTPGNSTTNLQRIYTGAQVYPVNTIAYFIRTGAGGRPSLYRLGGLAGAREIVEGVEQMQILYGVDTNADGAANTYVAANNANMAQVVSVRISLLVASIEDNIAKQAVPYTINGVTVNNPGDRRIRRVFNATIALRNRLN